MRLHMGVVGRLLGSALGAALLLGTTQAYAQNERTEDKAAAEANTKVEVLTRGPLHEAFATRFQTKASVGAKVDKEPPPLIDEVPPPVRPAGDDVVWIPGYWAWDAQAKDFLWISGTYRHVPPNHRWVPGYWDRVDGRFQWTSGFWAPADVRQLTYRSAPPKSLERGPTSEAPSEDYFYVPGSWEPRDDQYAWRPGYWAPCQANFVWTPAGHLWTPSGYVFVPGYWDYGVASRGMVFAPVRLAAGVQSAADVRFVPQTVIPVELLQFHLFTQADSNVYLFGNYYDESYADLGIRPWYTDQIVQGVSAPLVGHYQWLYGRSGTDYLDVLTKWNAQFVNNVDLRPALTLTEQIALAGKLQGVKNTQATLLASSLTDVVANAPADAFANLSAEQVAAVGATTRQIRLLGSERLKVEGGSGSPLDLASEGSQQIDVASQALKLPVVEVPRLPEGAVPLAPNRLIERGAPNVVPRNVPAPSLPPVRLPGLPF